jgi:hypothetical protein
MLATMKEVEQDFERLTETSMLFQGSDWEAQDGRFTDGVVDYTHAVIYWFERYSDLVLAKALVKGMGEDYTVLFDTAVDQWVMTSTYATESWKS